MMYYDYVFRRKIYILVLNENIGLFVLYGDVERMEKKIPPFKDCYCNFNNSISDIRKC